MLKIFCITPFLYSSSKSFFFCNDGCKAEFAASPAKFLQPAAPQAETRTPAPTSTLPVVNKDPVCGMMVNETKARTAGRVFDYAGKTYLFCNDGCKAEFAADPQKFLKPATNPVPSNEPEAHRDQPHH